MKYVDIITFFGLLQTEVTDATIRQLDQDQLFQMFTLQELVKLYQHNRPSMLFFRTKTLILSLDIGDGNTYIFKLIDRYSLMLCDIIPYQNAEHLADDPYIRSGFALFKN